MGIERRARTGQVGVEQRRRLSRARVPVPRPEAGGRSRQLCSLRASRPAPPPALARAGDRVAAGAARHGTACAGQPEGLARPQPSAASRAPVAAPVAIATAAGAVAEGIASTKLAGAATSQILSGTAMGARGAAAKPGSRCSHGARIRAFGRGCRTASQRSICAAATGPAPCGLGRAPQSCADRRALPRRTHNDGDAHPRRDRRRRRDHH